MKTPFAALFFALLLELLPRLALAQNPRYVTPNGAGTRDGSSWSNALSGTALQGALATAPSGTTVLVASGLYKPIVPSGQLLVIDGVPTSFTYITEAEREVSFVIPDGVEVYGGYTAGTTIRTTNPSSTTFSGDLNGDGTIGSFVTHTFSVVRIAEKNVVLDGLMITLGDARIVSQSLGLFGRGGGLYAGDGSSLTLREVQFVNNAAIYGGGMFVGRGSVTIRNCFFGQNQAAEGGGLYLQNSSGTLTNCSFSGDSAFLFSTNFFSFERLGYGAAIYNESSDPTLTSCSFNGNSAALNGGAMYNKASSPALINCSFNGNTAALDGGGMYNDGIIQTNSGPALTNCSFSRNTALRYGGAMYNNGFLGGYSSPTLTNCSFNSNAASEVGGAMFNDGTSGGTSTPVLTNCSFSGNTASGNGGAIYNRAVLEGVNNGAANPSFTNCIIWGNKAPAVISDQEGITYRYTDSQDGVQPGEGNRSVDPLFVDAPNGNLQLTACSPLIDAGDNSVNGGDTDLAGGPRRRRIIDMGAYEFQGTPTPAGAVAITRQPTSSSSVMVGANVRVPVGISGTTTSLQWYNQAGIVSGQTSATLTLNAVTTSQTGSYSLVATGSCNSVTTTAFSLTVQPPIRYVKVGGTGDGSSWAAASGDLQAMLNAAGVEQVRVAAGLYKPTPTLDRTVSFSITSGVQVYGGYAGTGPTPDARTVFPSSTTLSGNIGDGATNQDNSFQVVRFVNAGTQTRLDGFVITAGNANGSAGSGFTDGGGIYNDGSNGRTSSPTLINLVLVANAASATGGALFNNGFRGTSSPVLTNVSFQNNSAANNGGGCLTTAMLLAPAARY